MASHMLIAETPNAGEWGYRFLVSAGATIDDTTVSAFAHKGRGEAQTVGGNYLAVRHKVTQRTTGRPDADETLVLVGLDTSKITNNERARIVDTLRSLLPKLDAAVQEIDWGKEKRLVVPHSTLGEWLREDIRSLPIADIIGGPQEPGQTPARTEPDLPRNRPWKYTALWLKVSVLILLSVTAVGLITRKLSSQFGYTFVDTANSNGQKDENQEPGAVNSSSSDEFVAKLEALRSEACGTKDTTHLDGLRTRLYELEQGWTLTKNLQREIDDLRQELNRKQQTIKKEQARIRQENNGFYLEIENSLREAKDLGTLDSLLARLDQVPHPDKATEDEQQWQARLRDRIKNEQTELRWKDSEKEFRQLESSGDFKKARIHLRGWVGGKERELGVLKDRLDAAEDKSLYERIATSPSVAEERDRVRTYLNSPVVRKRMKKAVEGLKHYFDTANDDTTLTFSLTCIHWGHFWTGENTVELSVTRDGKEAITIAPVQVTAEREKELRLNKTPVEISFKAKPNARISLKLRVYNSKILDNGTFTHNGTMAELQGLSGEWVPLNFVPSDNGLIEQIQRIVLTANGNKIKFEVRGIPAKPKLPPWSED